MFTNCSSFICSLKALKREREFLAKRLSARLSMEEREALYMKWEVPLEGKQRRMQFINKLWTNPHDSRNIQESADIVANLVGLRQSGNLSKEMFELNFVLPSDKRPWIDHTISINWSKVENFNNTSIESFNRYFFYFQFITVLHLHTHVCVCVLYSMD